MLVAVQLFVLGLYLPPVYSPQKFGSVSRPRRSFHCQSTLLCDSFAAAGALVVLVAVQLSVLGLYFPPVLNRLVTIGPAPDDHFTAGPHCRVLNRAEGALVVLVAVQLSVLGLYLPPVLNTVPIFWLTYIHPRRSFHCRSRLPCDRLGQKARLSGWWLSNCLCWDYISRRCSGHSQLDLHPTRSFHCRSRPPCDDLGQAGDDRWWLSRYHRCIRTCIGDRWSV